MKRWFTGLWVFVLFLVGLLLSGCSEIEKVTWIVGIVLVLLVAVAIMVAIVIYHNRKHLPEIASTVKSIEGTVNATAKTVAAAPVTKTS